MLVPFKTKVQEMSTTRESSKGKSKAQNKLNGWQKQNDSNGKLEGGTRDKRALGPCCNIENDSAVSCCKEACAVLRV
jgi:hypothetical protein